MAGFIAHIPPEQAAAEVIDNEPFYPPIKTADVRAIARLDGTTTAEQLRGALLAACLHVNDELRAWQTEQQAQGIATLAAVPAPHIGGQSTRVHAYLRAVAHAALAHLESTKRAQSTLPAGLSKDARVLEGVGLRESEHWRIVRNSVADVQQRMREHVGLI